MEDTYIANEDCISSLISILSSNVRMSFSLSSKSLSKTYFMVNSLTPEPEVFVRKLNKFKYVNNLNLSKYNKFQNISQFRNLTSLSIGTRCDFKDISSLKNLYSLEISSNKLIDLEGLHKLTYLKFHLHHVKSITSLKALKKLFILGSRYKYQDRINPAKHIHYDLNQNTNLQTLILPSEHSEKSYFTDIRMLENLEYLACGNNNLFQNNYHASRLTFFSINYYNLKIKGICRQPQHHRLRNAPEIGDELYEEFSDIFYNMHNLQQLETLDYVSSKIICLQKLTYLFLQSALPCSNLTTLLNLKTLKLINFPYLLGWEGIANTTLENLTLGHSYYMRNFSFRGTFPFLTRLKIEKVTNEIDFSYMLNLVNLEIIFEGKKFKNIHLLTKLTELHLGGIIPTAAKFTCLTNLIVLDAGSNKIKSLNSFVKLTEIHLSPANINLLNECTLTNLRKAYLKKKKCNKLDIKLKDLEIYV